MFCSNIDVFPFSSFELSIKKWLQNQLKELKELCSSNLNLFLVFQSELKFTLHYKMSCVIDYMYSLGGLRREMSSRRGHHGGTHLMANAPYYDFPLITPVSLRSGFRLLYDEDNFCSRGCFCNLQWATKRYMNLYSYYSSLPDFSHKKIKISTVCRLTNIYLFIYYFAFQNQLFPMR